MSIHYKLHKNDLPADVVFGDVLSIDSEFMGLNPHRDRLCLLQIYDGNPEKLVHLVQFDKDSYAAPNLRKLMSDKTKQKLFFFARADMQWIGQYLGVIVENVCCLRIASRVARTYTQDHGLEDVLRHVLGLKISKEQQCTDWGSANLTDDQLKYASNDVLHLHALKEKLDSMLAREGRAHIAEGLSACLPAVVTADLAGWLNEDLFGYWVEKK